MPERQMDCDQYIAMIFQILSSEKEEDDQREIKIEIEFCSK